MTPPILPALRTHRWKIFCPRCEHSYETRATERDMQLILDCRCDVCGKHGVDSVEVIV